MASSYLAVLQGKQQELLHRLITHIIPVQRGDENYETAMEFCTGNLNPKYHRYKDVNAKEVRELYAGLCNRMEQHSQLSKASHLQQLCSRLSSLELQGKSGDMDAALLLLLFGLANKPLQRGRILTPQGPSIPPSTPIAASTTREPEIDDSSEELSSSWSSESALSDWEGGGEDGKAADGGMCGPNQMLGTPGVGQPNKPPDAGAEGDAQSGAAGWAGEVGPQRSVHPPLLPCTPEGRLHPRMRAVRTPQPSADAAGRLHMPAFPPMPATQGLARGFPQPQLLAAPKHDDLVSCLTRTRLQALPFMAPQPQKCLRDQYITHQVLNLLLNDSSTCFEHCPASSSSNQPTSTTSPSSHPALRYQPVAGLHVPYLSLGMLHALLCEFAEAGSQMAWLQAVIAASTHVSVGQPIRVPGITDGLHATSCCQAMLQAAAAQLCAISQPLIKLQQANMDGRAAHAHAHRTPSLLQLREQCSVPMRRLATLHEAVRLALRAQSAAEWATHRAGGSSGIGEVKAGSSSGWRGAEGKHSSAAAHASSVLLDALHMMLESNALMSGPSGQVLQQQLLHLFLCTLTPLLDGLYTWLYDNWEDHFPEDFFVTPGQHLPETHHLFWSEAFRLMLRHSATSYGQVIAEHVDVTQIACPRFLQPVACEIFSAGKSLRLLKNSEQGAGAATAPLPGMTPLMPPLRVKGQAHLRGRHHAPLQQQFLDQLHSFLAGHEACPALPVREHGQKGEGAGGELARQPGAAEPRLAATTLGGVQQEGWGGAGTLLQPLHPPSFSSRQDAQPSGATFPSAPHGAKPKAHIGGMQGSSLGYASHPTGPHTFSSRMAAAGLSRCALLQAGGAGGPAGELSMQLPLPHGLCSPQLGGFGGRYSRLGASSKRLSNGGMGNAGGRAVGQSSQQQAQQEGRGGLEAQCSDIAAVMCYRDPHLAWVSGGGHQHYQDALRPDVAQKLRVALMPGSLGHSSTSWLRPKEQAHAQLGWLLEEPCLDLPPMELLLEHCLLGILRQRVEDIGQCLLSCLLSDWGLLAELSSLKNLFLMASPSAQAWADRTLSGMLFHGRPLEEHHEYELDVALQEVIAEAGQDEALPSVDTISVMLDKERVMEMRSKAAATKASELGGGAPQALFSRSAHCALHSVLELEGLQFRYQPSWLMSMIGGSNSISSYNNALVFLMQIRAARMALEDARVRSWKSWKHQATSLGPYSSTPLRVPSPADAGVSAAIPGMPPQSSQQRMPYWTTGMGRPLFGMHGTSGLAGAASLNAKEEDLVMQEMAHFVSNLDQFVVDRLLCGAWMQLEQDLDQARTLDDVVRHHRTFLATLDRQAGRGTHGDTAGAWKHLVFGINKVLDQVLLFCSAQRALTSYQNKAEGSNMQLDGGVAGIQDSLRTASNEFRRLHRYLLKFLGNKTHKIGGEPDLENLIMRINFNYFYDASFL